ncbi:MAG: response regulator [Gammaproteobacteria bacterium]|nr:response regulator [Gammaproteobacteria bacterium]
MTRILIIDDDTPRRTALANDLREQGIEVNEQKTLDLSATSKRAALVAVHELVADELHTLVTIAPVVLLAPNPSVKASVAALQAGAKDYLALPTPIGDIMAAIERATAYSVRQPITVSEPVEMIGSSEIMNTLRQRIAKIGPTDSTVLILGQSGTGKELVARGIHAASNRSHAPLITLNCATVPANLIESELFGLAAYENRPQESIGLVEAASGGTLFLDEIAELPPSAQARLLQVVQGENRKVGQAQTVPVDVRIIAATHKDLKALTESGAFRSDLFYRLNVLCLELSPLRGRRKDIIDLAERLLAETCQRLNKPGLILGEQAKEVMLEYHWPGNVRELSNAIERAVILADDGAVITQALLAIEPSAEPSFQQTVEPGARQTSLEDYFVRFVQENEDLLTETELAAKLGISRKSLWERRQRLNIPRKKTQQRGPRESS